jgi:MFS family permease
MTSVARAQPSAKPDARAWMVLATAVVGTTFSPATLVNVPFGLFIIELQQAFGWSRAEISFALSAFIVALIATLPLMGIVIDRLGTRRALLLSIPAYTVALASMALLTPSLPHFYAVFVAIAVLGVGAQSLTYIKLLSAWFDSNRGLAIGLAMAGYGIGYLVVPLFTSAMIGAFGWRAAYLGLAALATVPLPLIVAYVRDRPSAEAPGEAIAVAAVPSDGVSLGQAMRHRAFWLLAISFILVSFALNGVQSQIVPLLRGAGYAPATAAIMLSAIGIGSIPGRVIAGYWMDRRFAGHIVIFFYALAAGGLIALLAGGPGWLTFLAAVAVGLGLGAENDALGFMASRYFGLRSFGQIYGLLFCCYLGGAALGPLAMAWGFDRTGAYDATLQAGLAAIGLACVLLAFLPPYRDRTPAA